MRPRRKGKMGIRLPVWYHRAGFPVEYNRYEIRQDYGRRDSREPRGWSQLRQRVILQLLPWKIFSCREMRFLTFAVSENRHRFIQLALGWVGTSSGEDRGKHRVSSASQAASLCAECGEVTQREDERTRKFTIVARPSNGTSGVGRWG